MGLWGALLVSGPMALVAGCSYVPLANASIMEMRRTAPGIPFPPDELTLEVCNAGSCRTADVDDQKLVPRSGGFTLEGTVTYAAGGGVRFVLRVNVVENTKVSLRVTGPNRRIVFESEGIPVPDDDGRFYIPD